MLTLIPIYTGQKLFNTVFTDTSGTIASGHPYAQYWWNVIFFSHDFNYNIPPERNRYHWKWLTICGKMSRSNPCFHGPLPRYVKMQVAHAPEMPGTFPPPPRVSDPDMHHGTCVTHVPWCMPGSLTSGFLGSRWQGKRSRHSQRMRNPQFYVSGKRPIGTCIFPWYVRAIYLKVAFHYIIISGYRLVLFTSSKV